MVNKIDPNILIRYFLIYEQYMHKFQLEIIMILTM